MVAAVVGGVVAAPVAAQVPPPPPPAAGDEPIIPDSEFEDVLPPLDPELNAPLEPLESLQPAAPSPTDPGLFEPASPLDPALDEPLPPLSATDLVPAETAEDVAAAGEEPAPIRYSVVIAGFEGTGLEGRFRDLSALIDARGEAANGAMIAARAEEDVTLAVRLLRSEGYFDAAASSAIEQVPDQPEMLRVTITVAPGEVYNFGDIRIAGAETEPPGMAREALPLQSGNPIIAEDVLAAEANVLLRLPQQGYPFPEIGQRDIELDPATRLGDYTLPLDPGPRARFGGFTTEGDEVFDDRHVEVLARFERGDLFDRRMVDDLREAMVSTRLFDSVAAEPVLTGEFAPDGTEYVNVNVRQERGPPRSFSAEAGFSTGQGLRLEGAWEHRNLFPPEGALRIAAIAGTAEQNVSLRFRRSNWRKRDRALLLELEAGQRDYEAFQGYTARIYGLVTRESTPIWQKVWTYSYGAELIATNESRFGTARLSLSDAYFIGGLIGSLGYDRSNSLLDPTEGFRLVGRLNPEVSLGNGTDYYLRSLWDATGYYPVSDNFVIAGRTRLGSIVGIPRDDLAPSRRLYAGGGGSVRGFGYQELGPRETIPNPDFDPAEPDKEPEFLSAPLGGRSLAEFAIEGRYRFGNYGVVAFVDAGQVYESQYPTFDSLRFGVGIGGRLYTNFGPVRVDVATPIDRRPGESRIAVYVSIGQAF